MPEPFKVIVEIPQSRIKLGTSVRLFSHINTVCANACRNVLCKVDEVRVWCTEEFFNKLCEHEDVKQLQMFYDKLDKIQAPKEKGKWLSLCGVTFIVQGSV